MAIDPKLAIPVYFQLKTLLLEEILDRLAELVLEHADGAPLVVAPELVTSGYDLDVLARRGRELAEPLDGPTSARVAELAAQTGATLVFGLLERDGDVLYDTAVVATPDGGLVPYRKSHLYPTESELFAAGDRAGGGPDPGRPAGHDDLLRARLSPTWPPPSPCATPRSWSSRRRCRSATSTC
jgi:predicted amidohydrolase